MDDVTSPVNPYEAPSGRVEDVMTEATSHLLASRLRRLGAALLDALFYGIGFIVALITIGRPDFADISWLLMAYGAAVPVLVVNLYFLARDGQSLGKKIAGIRILRTDGTQASLGRIFVLRMLAPGLLGVIPLLGPFFSLADSVAIFTTARRCIHDYMADTIVVQAV